MSDSRSCRRSSSLCCLRSSGWCGRSRTRSSRRCTGSRSTRVRPATAARPARPATPVHLRPDTRPPPLSSRYRSSPRFRRPWRGPRSSPAARPARPAPLPPSQPSRQPNPTTRGKARQDLRQRSLSGPAYEITLAQFSSPGRNQKIAKDGIILGLR